METTYKIYIYTDVYLDNYNEGEKEQVNYYTNSFTIDHYTPLKAISESFARLGFSFNNNHADIYTDDNGKQRLYYSHLCDVNNEELEETDAIILEFKEGKIDLYSNNHTVEVYKLTESNIF